ncbi:hypothetical protein ABL78_8409 [Leptomonas seymouri]|uniref:Uncharacterized protein n=1 Tax=Leptomonas seymouri TaxID=5684 RepID=A0A0N1P989_LEPSE|nr:hypothetical protein ABL78_8409 [Leptomonas seymouri]|eukprot:KPI82580.1 hypothetical protein ABL78_8409 [Leptomonas seymouri]
MGALGSPRLRRHGIGGVHAGGPRPQPAGATAMQAAAPGGSRKGIAERRWVRGCTRFTERFHGFSCLCAEVTPAGALPTVKRPREGGAWWGEATPSSCAGSAGSAPTLTLNGTGGTPINSACVPRPRYVLRTLRAALEVSRCARCIAQRGPSPRTNAANRLSTSRCSAAPHHAATNLDIAAE